MSSALNFIEELHEKHTGNEVAVDALFIEPPCDEGEDSCEDDLSDDELEGGATHLCNGQQKTGCEIRMRGAQVDDDDEEEEEFLLEEIEVDVISEATASNITNARIIATAKEPASKR